MIHSNKNILPVFCPSCKEKIDGKFCSECGAKGVEKNKIGRLGIKSWREEKDLGQLIKNPAVQVYIKSFLAKSKQSISAEEFLQRMDVLISPLTGLSLTKLMDITVPIYKKIGIKTGKSKTDDFKYTIQEVLLKILCSLVKHNYPLKEVHEANNAIILIASIPSSMKTFGGELIISLEEKTAKTAVTVDVKITGQLYDWGKSKSIVKALFLDIEEIALDLE